MSLLADKVVIITGSSRGIGRACALEAARHGAKLVLHYLGDDVTTKEAESLKKEIEGLGRQAVIIPGDIAKQETSIEVRSESKPGISGCQILTWLLVTR
jgi:L-rhamnose 1-dehydrogenase